MEVIQMSPAKQLSAERCVKQFFESEWNDEKHLIHCKCVIDACLGMVHNTHFDPVVFILAGWLHDMGKLIDKENHHQESLKFVKKFMDKHPEYCAYADLVEDCVVNHRSVGTPSSEYARIFQLADKISLHNHDWIAYKKRIPKVKSI